MDENIITLREDDGGVKVYVPVGADFFQKLSEDGVETNGNGTTEEMSSWHEGQLVYPGYQSPADSYRTPRLSVPENYYTRVEWSNEYYQQEPLVHSLVNRDIDQAVSTQEFQMPEEKVDEHEAIEDWSRTLNRGLNMYGGLRQYNHNLMLDLVVSGFSFTLANWGPLLSGKKVYQFPKSLINLNPMSVVPRFDALAGVKRYYLMLSSEQYEAIKKRRKNSITQIIPDARARLTNSLDFVTNSQYSSMYRYNSVPATGYYLELPTEGVYVCGVRTRQQDLYPMPTLVPIFSAIAMKRKLALADWSVADGMVNMIMVWEFPPNTNPSKAKGIVQKFMSGGRVQSHAVPAGVKVSLITPDVQILNSAEKFWVPISEILAHFGYPLNSRSRGAGDLDSGSLDLSSNRARLQFWREIIQSENNYWLEQIAERNGWDFDVYSIFQTRDLDDDANFRTFASALYDRGLLSVESIHDLANTSTEREAARRRKEKKDGLEDLFSIRPSFSQTIGPATGGRPAKGDEKPKATEKTQGAGYRKTQTEKVQ